MLLRIDASGTPFLSPVAAAGDPEGGDAAVPPFGGFTW